MRRFSSFFSVQLKPSLILDQAVRHYLSHQSLLSKMNKIGYPSNNGVCHGLACVATYHFLMGDIEVVDHNMKWMARCFEAKSPQPAHLTHFLDKIIIAQDVSDFKLLHSEKAAHQKITYQDTMHSLSLIEDEASKQQGGIKAGDFFSGAYSIDELTLFFSVLQKTFQHFAYRVAFIISAVHHAIMIGFDPSKNEWLHIDVDGLPSKRFHNERDIARATNGSLSKKRISTIFSTHVLTTGKYEMQLKKAVQDYQSDRNWIRLHRITKRKIALSDTNQTNWLTTACREGQFNEVQLMIQSGVEIDHQNLNGMTALFFAVFYNRINIVRLLLENGASAFDDENLYLTVAAEYGYDEIAELLIKYGAEITEGNPSPIFLAAEHGHHKLMQLFSKHQKTGPGKFFLNEQMLDHRASIKVPEVIGSSGNCRK